MKKLLIICGPTATGKTDLGIYLARKFDGEIVSGDSRQVYRGMDIGTGKEWGDGVKIWGYDLIDPKKEFSVAQYEKFAKETIKDIHNRNKLPILTGGTGFYIKAVVDGISTSQVPRNQKLRDGLKEKTPHELFDILAEFDPVRAENMNRSDKNNPRRLIRAIEVAAEKGKVKGLKEEKLNYEVFFIGLTAPKEFLDERIRERVGKRMDMGILDEVRKLLKGGVKWDDQSMSSLGYREWKDYFGGKKSLEETVKEWEIDEINYVKRQMVWFKKDKRIVWFDVLDSNYGRKMENMVKKWYSGMVNAKKN